MERKESNIFDIFAKTNKNSEPQHETPDKPLPPPWSTSMQAYHNPWFTPTTSLTPAGSHFYPSWWPNQAWGMPRQYDSLHDHRRLSNYPMASGVGQGAALAFSEKVLRMFGGKNLDSMEKSDENLQLKSLVTKESKENGKRSSIPKSNWEGVSWSAASGSMGSPYEGHDANNVYGSTKILFKEFPSTKKQQCNMKLGNGQDAQKVTSLENCNAVHENRSFASHVAANPTELNQNLGTGLNASGTNPQPEKLESDETRKARKRQSNRESSRRRKMRKEKECEELSQNVDNLRVKNSELKEKLLRLSEECEELTNENNSILEELVEKYGQESVENLMNTKAA